MHGSFLDPLEDINDTHRNQMHLRNETSEGDLAVADLENNFMINQNGQGS